MGHIILPASKGNIIPPTNDWKKTGPGGGFNPIQRNNSQIGSSPQVG